MSTIDSNAPLFVDLDGSLVRTDTLWESIALLHKAKPSALLMLPIWALRGKSTFKRRIADITRPEPSLLPYNEELLEYLKSEALTRDLYLVSAADQRIVSSVADYLGIFKDALGSSEGRNLRGHAKLAAIREIAQGQPFEYVGNENADIPIWKESQVAHVVSPSSTYRSKMSNTLPGKTKTYKADQPKKAYVKALRPHQWIKNILVFAPFLLAHVPPTFSDIGNLLTAFFCLSLVASSVYVFNDILDIESDRRHPDKKHRPFANATIPIQNGIFLSAILLVVSVFTSLVLMPWKFTCITIGYLILANLYTFYLKKLLLIDILCLSSFYTIRILAGSQASQVEISPWFLAFSSCFFLSLAYAKRYVEIINNTEKTKQSINGRGYLNMDANIIQSSGIACGFLSVLVFFLYITNSPAVSELYQNPMYLWLVGPILVYWISRIWILAHRKEMHSDPVLFAVKDRVSWSVGFAVVLIVLLSSFA